MGKHGMGVDCIYNLLSLMVRMFLIVINLFIVDTAFHSTEARSLSRLRRRAGNDLIAKEGPLSVGSSQSCMRFAPPLLRLVCKA